MTNDDLDKQAIAQEILGLLGSQDEKERKRLVTYLGFMGTPNIIPQLYDELFDPLVEILLNEVNEFKRADAALLLGYMESGTAVTHLLHVLNLASGQWSQASAIKALGQLGDVRAIPKLASILTDTQNTSQIIVFVRTSAAFALGEIGDKSALPALLEAIDNLDESESLTQRFAVDAIGRITDKDAAAHALIGLLSHKTSYVRGFAAQRLGFLAAKSDDVVLRSRVAHKLIDVLKDTGSSRGYWGTVAGEAARSLTFIDDPEGNAALELWRQEMYPDDNDQA